jgi:hypothetical protein
MRCSGLLSIGIRGMIRGYTNLGHAERMLGNFESARGRYLTRIDLGLKKIENVPPEFVNRQRLLLRHVRVCLAFTLLELGGQSNESEAKKLFDDVLIADPSYHQAAAGLFLLCPARWDLPWPNERFSPATPY